MLLVEKDVQKMNQIPTMYVLMVQKNHRKNVWKKCGGT